jgi:ribonuclease BN (tRNA processing enzyme)
VRLTVLGACGAFPEARLACSGFLLEHDGHRLLVDAGYAVMPELLRHVDAHQVDAVYITHGHPDHCADLNPLLRARALRDEPAPPLPVYALPGALDAVLALDRPGMLDAALDLHQLRIGEPLRIGPFTGEIRMLPHSRPNAGLRLKAGDEIFAYTGDAGPHPDTVELARDADLFVAEASFVDEIPNDLKGTLNSAQDVARQARQAGAKQLILTHLMRGTDPEAALAAAGAEFEGPVRLAKPQPDRLQQN